MSEKPRSGARRGLYSVLIIGILSVIAWSSQDYIQTIIAGVFPEQGENPKAVKNVNWVKRPAPVIVDTVGQQADTVVVQAIGTARAVRSVTLFPDAEGEIVSFPVRADARINENDVILELNSSNDRLAVQVAETRVKEAESALARAEKLRNSNVQSAATVDDAQIILERTRLELKQSKDALANRTLLAPFPGIIGIPKVEIGDRVTTTTEIATLDDRTTLLVEFDVSEQHLYRLQHGATVQAQTAAFYNQVFEGRIDKIDSRIDPVTRTVLVRAAFDNADDKLRPGMSFFVTVNLPGPVLAAVPELALRWENGVSYVWRIRDDSAERVDVETRRRLNTMVLVVGDLQPGDNVVVEGVQRMRPGKNVTITNNTGS